MAKLRGGRSTDSSYARYAHPVFRDFPHNSRSNTMSPFASSVIPIPVASVQSRYNTHEETLEFISLRRNSVADMKLPADVFLLRVLQISPCLARKCHGSR